jgi:hypothetical protein
MFRRIEFIVPGRPGDLENHPPFLAGLMVGSGSDEVLDAWIEDLRGPARASLPANCRFYFTEKGWREVGMRIAAAAQGTGSEYRVIKIKETDAQVVWRDKARGYEVAVQPLSKRKSTKVPDPSDG